jgi:hypothetical protein
MTEQKKTYLEWFLQDLGNRSISTWSINQHLVTHYASEMPWTEAEQHLNTCHRDVESDGPFYILKIVSAIQEANHSRGQEIIDALIESTSFKFEKHCHSIEYREHKFWIEEFGVPLQKLWEVASPAMRTEERYAELLEFLEVCKKEDRWIIKRIQKKVTEPLDLEEELAKFHKAFAKKQLKIEANNAQYKAEVIEKNEQRRMIQTQMNEVTENLTKP